MTVLATFGIADLRDAYARGELTPAEVAEQVIAAPSAPGVWISRVPAGALRARAREPLDPALPLYGVPFAVKDNIDVAGMPTTAACPAFAYTPARSAPVVERLLAAGAMLVGKTNLDQFATGLTGSRSPYGAVESVFGGGLIAGGSSSGSAVAVASGAVAFALGTDTAGSGRVPAALNGIVGLKPTRGLLSTAGVVPACRSLDCVSIFAVDVADARTVLDVARGPAAEDPWSRAATGESLPPAAVRLGVARPDVLDFEGDHGQAERYVAGCLTAARLTSAATQVDLTPLLEAGGLLYEGPWVAERLADLEDFLDAHAEAVLPLTLGILRGGRRFSAADTFRAQHRLQVLKAATARLFTAVDVLALPTVPTTFTLDEIAEEPLRRNAVLGRYTQFANLLDLAVVTVPNGTTPQGRPASLSLIGPAFAEGTLLGLAAAFRGETVAVPETPATTVELAVAGHHLRGEARNAELVALGGRFARTTRTEACYRLYRLPTGVPGLVRVGAGQGARIEVEIWRLPSGSVGALLSSVKPPLSIGYLSTVDGETVQGFLCEAYAAADAQDITASGGFRAHRQEEGQ
ncbi:allophanate hydrolase [Dactylosporangium aurantiacum]|uniref:Allophanate hydrolase n=1 Tax=Dactylosporangium aurantiacum TaxID=35754 RepID=A0A9Q9IMF5_9ACTN|nr:allophanate hydrolase [Dactylosporangium aurantiacum]MDG6104337.1 allophanate hydrolase [Dactylosporangium aurantiacum]UWZ56675.1 allophanate hydrolase [Dactylosporangium aurantiacum]